MAAALPFLAGQADSSPPGVLSRFLPPIPGGIAAAWLERTFSLPRLAGEPAPWILDPFGAAPETAVEVARGGYRVLVAANNPIARFLLELWADPPSESELRAGLAALSASYKGDERLEPHLRGLYRTHCPSCSQPVMAEAFIWEKDGTAPVARILTCPRCNPDTALESPVDAGDLEQAARFGGRGLHRARALERVAPLGDPDRPFAEEAVDAYLPRALFALITLVNKLDSLDPAHLRAVSALLLAAFDAANTLWPHPPARPGRHRPRQLIPPPRFRENNVWLALEAAIETLGSLASSGAPVPLTIYPALPPESGGLCIFEGRLKDVAGDLERMPVGAVLGALPRPNAAFWTLSALWAGWLWGQEGAAPFKAALRRRRYDWGWHATALAAALRELSPRLTPATPFLGLVSEAEPGFLTAAAVGADLGGFSLQGIALRDELAQFSWLAHPADGAAEALPLQQSMIRYLQARGEPAPALPMMSAGLLGLAQSGQLSDLQTEPKSTPDPAEIPGQSSSIRPAAAQSALQDRLESALRSGRGFIRCPGPAEGGVASTAKWWLDSDSQPVEPPLSDRVEMAVVNWLKDHPGSRLADLDRAACETFPGLLTPDLELVQAVLSSYGAEQAGEDPAVWRLRSEDTPRLRRAELDSLRATVLDLGKRLGYRSSQQETTIQWKARGEAGYTIFVRASAVLGNLLLSQDTPPGQPVLVYPGGRAGLIDFKLRSDPRLAQAAHRWLFVKFRHLRRLSEDTSLTHQTFRAQIDLDPLANDEAQIRLF